MAYTLQWETQDSKSRHVFRDFLIHFDWRHLDGLVQERRNSIASALELRHSSPNPSIYNIVSTDIMMPKFKFLLYEGLALEGLLTCV